MTAACAPGGHTMSAIRDAITTLTGIGQFGQRDMRLVRAVARRCDALGCDARTYQHRVLAEAANGTELARLVDEITVGETWFFRHAEQLDFMFDVVIRERLLPASSRSPLTIWIAGCASGAEAYSLAMLFDEKYATALRSGRVSIIATDINQRCLDQARTGVVSPLELRGLPPRYCQRYFTEQDGKWHFDDALQRHIQFQQHNFLAELPPGPARGKDRFDIILCRNVLMYFSAANVKRAARIFANALADDGALVIGSTDPFPGLADHFMLAGPARSFVYGKRDRKQSPYRPTCPLPEVTALTAAPSISPARKPDPASAPDAAPELDDLAKLIDRGEWQQAAIVIEKLRSSEEVANSPRFHVFDGLLAEHSGRTAYALACYRAAVYLDPGDPLMEFHLGRVALQLEDEPLAIRSFRNALHLCHASTTDSSNMDIPPDRLADMALTQLQRLESACR